MNFTQPCCEGCYRSRHPAREPLRIVETELEACCYCGAMTEEGIYVRADPSHVPFPSAAK